MTLIPLALLGIGLGQNQVSHIDLKDRGRAVEALVAEHGEANRGRATLGTGQVANQWRPDDGTSAEYVTFCTTHFLSKPTDLDGLFHRIQGVMERTDGSTRDIQNFVFRPFDLETVPLTAADSLLAEFDLAARAEDELYRSKLAFVALLNFPVHRQTDRAGASAWSRTEWAKSRMMDRFSVRLPASAIQTQRSAYMAATSYVAGLKLYTGSVTDRSGKPLYRDSTRLTVHWGLRDEITALYGEPDPGARQEALFTAMERIAADEVPAGVIDNPGASWSPESNKALVAGPGSQAAGRFESLLAVFRAERAADQYFRPAATFLDRRFLVYRQMDASEVERLVTRVLTAPEVRQVSEVARKRLGRSLRPYDLWFTAFGKVPSPNESELDQTVRRKYPSAAAFQADLPRLLQRLGFERDRSEWLSSQIVVEPSRGAGHALGPARRGEPARLRTRVSAGGMDYKSFNIAIHELGHCVEQVLSLYEIDHWFLRGVPNEAFTEALAFVFQFRNLELLDLPTSHDVLVELWATYGTAGSALVDIKVWQWLYANPDATGADLRRAVVRISAEVWDKYFAPLLGRPGSPVLGVYSHMIDSGLYLPDYVIGRVAAFQLSKRISGSAFGPEFERTAKLGNLTPDAWMRAATGAPLSVEPMLEAARASLTREEQAPREREQRRPQAARPLFQSIPLACHSWARRLGQNLSHA